MQDPLAISSRSAALGTTTSLARRWQLPLALGVALVAAPIRAQTPQLTTTTGSAIQVSAGVPCFPGGTGPCGSDQDMAAAGVSVPPSLSLQAASLGNSASLTVGAAGPGRVQFSALAIPAGGTAVVQGDDPNTSMAYGAAFRVALGADTGSVLGTVRVDWSGAGGPGNLFASVTLRGVREDLWVTFTNQTLEFPWVLAQAQQPEELTVELRVVAGLGLTGSQPHALDLAVEFVPHAGGQVCIAQPGPASCPQGGDLSLLPVRRGGGTQLVGQLTNAAARRFFFAVISPSNQTLPLASLGLPTGPGCIALSPPYSVVPSTVRLMGPGDIGGTIRLEHPLPASFVGTVSVQMVVVPSTGTFWSSNPVQVVCY